MIRYLTYLFYGGLFIAAIGTWVWLLLAFLAAAFSGGYG